MAVVGSQGQLGAAVVHELGRSYDVVALTRADLDITDDVAVAGVFGRIAPDVILNCAAYNDVDGAEDRPTLALNVNAFAVRALARAATDRRATLVHFSTDFVFDGTGQQPYSEQDRPNPRSVYAVSKLTGEWFAEEAPRAYVLRVESLFGRAPTAPIQASMRGSVAGILKAVWARTPVRVFEDRTVTPTCVTDVARAVRHLLEARSEPGVYHCVNSGSCTWLAFAQELVRQLGMQAELVPVRLADMKLRASRPLYCALSNEKLSSAGFVMPSWQDALARFLQDVASEMPQAVVNRDL
jgi:dTDP-4-dehydrorhamnose reductase